MMRYIYIFILSSIAFNISAQCVKCTSVDEAFKEPKKVKELIVNPYVTGVGLEEFPENIELLENIEILYLTDHGFTEVPKELGLLQNLKELSLAGNLLESIPEEIFELKNLKELILFSNNFTEESATKLKKELKKKRPKLKVLIDWEE